jgi:hypothetical protein
MLKKSTLFCLFQLAFHVLTADEGMWMLHEPDTAVYQQMQAMGFSLSPDRLYSAEQPSVKDAIVRFNGGCTGITVSGQGLIFTNHHCGYDAIQAKSSVEHDYLKNGFVAHAREEEIPVEGLSVSYLIGTENLTERFLSAVRDISDEKERSAAIDSMIVAACDSASGGNPFIEARVAEYFDGNAYYLHVYENFTDVRMVFAPPSSVGKFGGDTDNWMWPRHTGDFSVFRVYANADNQPVDYNTNNVPYKPRYYAPISLDGYRENDFAMTVGYPGRTERYLSSYGIYNRVNNINIPRITVRSVKQQIWKEAMQNSDEIRIMYASKYARSSNYQKHAAGMNRSIERLQVIEKKRKSEQQFKDRLDENPAQKAAFGEAPELIANGYQSSDKRQNALTYLTETLIKGAEIVGIATGVIHFDPKKTTIEQEDPLKNDLFAPYKNYSPPLDEQVLAAMLTIAKEKIPAEYLPGIFVEIDKKYKGNYAGYAADLFKKSVIPYPDKLLDCLRNPKKYRRLQKDPAWKLAMSCRTAFFDMMSDHNNAIRDLEKGERLFMAGWQEMLQEQKRPQPYPDANSTMRMSYGRIGSYVPYDAAWYNYYTTTNGIFEKYRKDDPEFDVQPEILDLLRAKNFGRYGNGQHDMNLCFISNNDITGGNSGSPVFNGQCQLIGLAFDGNWEAMSGDIIFEPLLQKTISVDIRYVLFMIEQWGKCRYLFDEIELISKTAPSDKLPE